MDSVCGSLSVPDVVLPCPVPIRSLPVQLLVSVRDVNEADAAIAGHADIIDVKEPARGSLGMASLESIAAIVSRCRKEQNAPHCSAALGELQEWLGDAEQLPTQAAGFAIPGLNFLKVGLSAARQIPDWQSKWLEFRRQFPSSVQWVAVAYADADRAGSPGIAEVMEAAAATDCRVLLLDTFVKDATTLLSWFSADELLELRRRCTELGLRLALAGRLGMPDLPVLQRIAPDLLAVRGAVCDGSDRSKTVCQEMVQRLRLAMR
jgi:uncharacterized protein (UPF0264 family)